MKEKVVLPQTGQPEDYSPGEISEELNLLYSSAVEAWEKGNLQRADLLLSQISRQRPGLASPYTFRGLIAQGQGEHEKARTFYEEALALNGAEHKALHQLALLARQEGDFRKAEALYLRAIDTHPEEAAYHRNLAILYDLYLGDLPRAIQHYERYQQYSPEADKQVAIWVVDLKRRAQ